MNDIEQKALELVNEVCVGEREMHPYPCVDRRNDSRWEALCRAIEQHEAFRQEVSDAVEAVFAGYHDAPIPWVVMRRKLEPFIIAKPDPLVEAIAEAFGRQSGESEADDLRAALAKRGGRIVFDD